MFGFPSLLVFPVSHCRRHWLKINLKNHDNIMYLDRNLKTNIDGYLWQRLNGNYSIFSNSPLFHRFCFRNSRLLVSLMVAIILAKLKGKYIRDFAFLISEHLVKSHKSRNWFWKHWWKNQWKILFCSRYRSF